MSEVKVPVHHYWMVVGNIQYNQNDVAMGVKANVIASTPEPKFNHKAFDGVQREFARRVVEEHGVNPNDITNIVMDNICYLGEMTQEEMFGQPPAQADEAPKEHPAQQ